MRDCSVTVQPRIQTLNLMRRRPGDDAHSHPSDRPVTHAPGKIETSLSHSPDENPFKIVLLRKIDCPFRLPETASENTYGTEGLNGDLPFPDKPYTRPARTDLEHC